MSILQVCRLPVFPANGYVWQLLRLSQAIFVALVLAACATVPMGDGRDDAYLKSFPTKAAVAGIYIYREQAIYASGVPLTIDVDGNPIGQTAIKTYLYTEVPPGFHTIASRSIGPYIPDSIEIQTFAGQNYFVFQDMVMNLAAVQTKLRLVSEAEGKRGVLAANLARSQMHMPAMPQDAISPQAGMPFMAPPAEQQKKSLKWLLGSQDSPPTPQAGAATEDVPIPAPIPSLRPIAAGGSVKVPTSNVSPQIQASSHPRKIALVIGNGSYSEAPLKNPVNDARAVASKLSALGFEVMRGENLGLREMTRLITRFGEKAGGTGVGLFFYAGHGMQVKGRNYLLPVDAQITSEASARSESIDLDQILDQLSASGGQFSLVVLDACRNNPFERRFRGSGGGLAQIDAPKGTLIAYATAPGRVAADGDGNNSTYTTALLRALDEPGLPVESVFKQVRGEVSRATGDQQVPWESSSLTGDFYFIPKPDSAGGASTSDSEMLFWQSVRESKDPDDFRAYLRKYPNGQFSEIARNRIKRLTGR